MLCNDLDMACCSQKAALHSKKGTHNMHLLLSKQNSKSYRHCLGIPASSHKFQALPCPWHSAAGRPWRAWHNKIWNMLTGCS